MIKLKLNLLCWHMAIENKIGASDCPNVRISELYYYFEAANQRLPSVCHPISVDPGGTPEVRVNDLEKGQSELSMTVLSY